MTVTESDIIRDEAERSSLERAISDLETAIAVSNPGTRRILELSLNGAKIRVSTLDKKIEDAKVERAVAVQTQAALAAKLAAKETALNASEREEYGSFLKEDFFTKKDFGKLAQFYAHTWDRLSEGGKEEMSHRVWEGIRHGEYEFRELPREVQEKEAKRLYGKLTSPNIDQGSLANIPEPDRTDFIQVYSTGNRNQIGEVLSRTTFKRNVSLETSTSAKHQAINSDKGADDSTILARNDSTQTNREPSVPFTAAASKFDSLSLKDVKLTDSAEIQSAANIADASGTRTSAQSPV